MAVVTKLLVKRIPQLSFKSTRSSGRFSKSQLEYSPQKPAKCNLLEFFR